jgi:hypothetical protein
MNDTNTDVITCLDTINNTIVENTVTFNPSNITTENPLSLTDAMSLSDADKLLLLEGFLSGNLVTKGDSVIPKPIRETGPRGQTPRVAAAHDRLRTEFLKLAAGKDGVTTNDLNDLAHSLPRVDGDKVWEYHYIKTVATDLLAEGLITETKKGRQAIWKLVA